MSFQKYLTKMNATPQTEKAPKPTPMHEHIMRALAIFILLMGGAIVTLHHVFAEDIKEFAAERAAADATYRANKESLELLDKAAAEERTQIKSRSKAFVGKPPIQGVFSITYEITSGEYAKSTEDEGLPSMVFTPSLSVSPDLHIAEKEEEKPAKGMKPWQITPVFIKRIPHAEDTDAVSTYTVAAFVTEQALTATELEDALAHIGYRPTMIQEVLPVYGSFAEHIDASHVPNEIVVPGTTVKMNLDDKEAMLFKFCDKTDDGPKSRGLIAQGWHHALMSQPKRLPAGTCIFGTKIPKAQIVAGMN